MKAEAQEKENWKQLLSALPEPILLVKQGVIVYYNEAALNVLGVHGPMEERVPLIEERLQNVQSQERAMTLYSVIKDSSVDTQPRELYRLQAGEKHTALEVKSVHISQTDSTVTEYIISDISLLEDLQMARAAQSCLKILVGTASHSVRTPLNIMEGALDLALDIAQDSAVIENLRLAKASAQQMNWYLLALSYLQQLDDHSLQIDPTTFDIRAAVAEIVALYECSTQSKNIPVVIKYGLDVPQTYCTDKEKFQLILSFLLRNASKYTFHGSISISVNVDPVSRSIITEVRDTGIGIAPKVAQRLFQLMPDVESGDRLNPQGIGLGLYVSKALSKELRGDLSVASAERQGTIAKLVLPEFAPSRTLSTSFRIRQNNSVLSVVSSPHESQPLPLQLSRCHCHCPPVLIVDDEPLNVKVLKAFLAKAGYSADAASNGQEALDAVLARSEGVCCSGYKVILMDINMPLMDGAEATQRIKQLIKEKVVPETPIIAVTAAVQLENADVSARYAELGFKRIRNVQPFIWL